MAKDTLVFRVLAPASSDISVEVVDLADPSGPPAPRYPRSIAAGRKYSFTVYRSAGNPQWGNIEFWITDPVRRRLFAYDTPYNNQLIEITDDDIS